MKASLVGTLIAILGFRMMLGGNDHQHAAQEGLALGKAAFADETTFKDACERISFNHSFSTENGFNACDIKVGSIFRGMSIKVSSKYEESHKTIVMEFQNYGMAPSYSEKECDSFFKEAAEGIKSAANLKKAIALQANVELPSIEIVSEKQEIMVYIDHDLTSSVKEAYSNNLCQITFMVPNNK